jgi:hypothetical protein
VFVGNGVSPVLAVPALAGAIATFGRAASSHRNPCHSAHTCPSDHHTYLRQGLSCTSYPDEREPSDTKVVLYHGRRY